MQFFTRLRKDTKGIALVEFAIAAPVLLIMLFGSIEVARYALYRDKLESAAMQMMDVINQNNSISVAGMRNLYNIAFPELVAPFTQGSPTLIITFVKKPVVPSKNCKPVAAWQWRSGSGASKVAGGKNQVATVGNVPIANNDFLIVVEVYGTYSTLLNIPMADGWLKSGGRNYAISYGRPRFREFSGADPNTLARLDTPCL